MDNDTVTITRAKENYQNHLSLKVKRENIDSTNNLIDLESISKIINNLGNPKATQQDDISTKFIKENKDLFSYIISVSFNNAANNDTFQDELKDADIKQIYKNGSRNEKENYRPAMILLNLSNDLLIAKLHV